MLLLLVSLSAISVIPDELLSKKVPGNALMITNVGNMDLPVPVQHYLERSSAKKSLLRQLPSFLVCIFRASRNDAVFYNTLSAYLTQKTNLSYYLFPDAGLAYVFDPINGSWQLLKVKHNAQLAILSQSVVADSPHALLPKT
ncbi:hypothetical protein [Flavobacterium sp.]|uniref:hypothetical protein n=1 Tax=Flavobacterium sp. TaxID=239 RepID=UPI004033B220